MTTFTTVHVYQLSAAVYAAYRNDRPFVRPQRIRDEEGQLAWRGWRRVVPMAPLVASFVIPRGASDDDIRREVAYLALTEWTSTAIEVAVDSKTIALALSGATLSPAAQPLTEAELAHAARRADAEAALDAATMLDDAAALRWLDGDRSALPGMLALAEAAQVRAFGVYAGAAELLDTIVVGQPLPLPESPSLRPPAPRGSTSEMVWPGVRQTTVASAVRRGFARYVDPLAHVVELTPAGQLASLTGTAPAPLSPLLRALTEGPLKKAPATKRAALGRDDGSIRSRFTVSSFTSDSHNVGASSLIAGLEDDPDSEALPDCAIDAGPMHFDTSEDGGDMLRRMLARYSGEHVAHAIA